MANSVNVLDVLSVACAAYRINGNEVLRESKDNKIANGVLVKAHYLDNKKIEVTDEDCLQAQEVKDYISQRVMLFKLTGSPVSDFVQNIFELVEKDTVHLHKLGLLVWAPKVKADLVKVDDQRQELSVLSFGSQYLGKVGDKIETEFVAVTERWTTAYNCYRYTGHDNKGNLIGFLTGNKLSKLDGVKIKGRIKTIENGRFTGGKTTYLNYVKEIK